MTQVKTFGKINSQSAVEFELVEAAFNFWYNDAGHIRSPFPAYIRHDLKKTAEKNFIDWAFALPEKAKKEINDEIMAEKLEEIIFETSIPMVLTEDERLTILYPFLPRVGDLINDKKNIEAKSENKVIDRKIIVDGDHKAMKVVLRRLENGETWETDFELPA